MHISEKLGELNYNRNQEWSLPFTPNNARHAAQICTIVACTRCY